MSRTIGGAARRCRSHKLLGVMAALALLMTLVVTDVTAAQPSSGQPSANLDQCRNGSATSPADCDTGAYGSGGSTGWENGNAGPSNAHFVEGYSIPYRAVMENLPTGSPITLIVEYDITATSAGPGGASVKALDFLTHYDRLQSHLGFGHAQETLTPTDGVTGVGAMVDEHAIPAPTEATTATNTLLQSAWGNVGAAKKVMTLFGGDITNVAYVSQGDFDLTGAKTQLAITFTSQNPTAVLAWGGHIARGKDWGIGLSASGISGSPYHMRLIDWNLNNLGNQDRSLKASAVFPTGTIIVKKVCSGATGGPFGYTTTGTGFAGANGGDGSFNLNCGGTATYEDLLATGTPGFGDYSVAETSLASGFFLKTVGVTEDITTNSTCETSPFTNDGLCDLTLDANETITVTYTNEAQGSITIVKKTIGANGTFAYTGDLGSFNIATTSNTGSKGPQTVTAGTYAVTESDPTSAGFEFVSVTCDDGASTVPSTTSGRTATIKVEPAENVTCTFTNRAFGAIRILKKSTKSGNPRVSNAGAVFAVDGPDADTTADFSVTDDNTAAAPDEDADTGEVCVSGLSAGTYTVNETTPPTGYGAATTSNVEVVAVAGTNCTTNLPSGSGEISFLNDPLADIQVSFRDGGSGETKELDGNIDCRYSGESELTPDSTTVPSAWSSDPTADKAISETHLGLAPGTVVCTIQIDP